MMRAVIAGALAFVALAACAGTRTTPATDVIVEIDSDLGADLAAVEVRIEDANEHAHGGTHRFELGKDLRVPFTFGVRPSTDPHATIVVVATARSAGGGVLSEAKAKAVFAQGRTLGPLVLFLSRACRAVVPCDPGTACSAPRAAAAPTCESIPSPRLGTYRARPLESHGLYDAGVDGSTNDTTHKTDASDHANNGGAGGSHDVGSGGDGSHPGSTGSGGSQGSGGNPSTPQSGPSIPALCRDKSAGDAVCDSDERKRCNADLQLEPYDCPSNAHCEAVSKTVSCACDSGFVDDGSGSCSNVDDCANDACGAGATACKDGVNTRVCTCGEGYEGTGSAACINIDDCAGNPCGDGGTCSDDLKTYTCECDERYYSGTGTMACVDRNECDEGNGGCGDPQWYTCHNNEGAPPACGDVNECAKNNGGCGGHQCINNVGGPPSCSNDDFDECAAGLDMCLDPYPCVNRSAGDYYDCRGQFPDWSNVGSLGPYSASGGYVLDMKTGLQWQQSVNGVFDWDNAKRSCSDLSGGSWRVPTKAELESIVDYASSDPAIDLNAFPDAHSDTFWTASPYGSSANKAWSINFQDGSSSDAPTGQTLQVRCVR